MDRIVKAVITGSRGYLTVRKIGSKSWGFVGGGTENGEGERKALRRESGEEIGIEKLVIHSRFKNNIYLPGIHGKRHSVAVYYCTLPSGARPVASSEIEEYKWIRGFDSREMTTTSRKIVSYLELPRIRKA